MAGTIVGAVEMRCRLKIEIIGFAGRFRVGREKEDSVMILRF